MFNESVVINVIISIGIVFLMDCNIGDVIEKVDKVFYEVKYFGCNYILVSDDMCVL